MVLHAEQERVRLLLKEAIPLLCKNGLTYNKEFCIEALVGITLDKNDVFLVSIKETVAGEVEVTAEHTNSQALEVASQETGARHQVKDHSPKSKSSRKRKLSSKDQSQTNSDIEGEDIFPESSYSPTPIKREKASSSSRHEDTPDIQRPEKCTDSQSASLQSAGDEDNDTTDELMVIKCEPGLDKDYAEASGHMGNTSTQYSSMQQVYPGYYPGSADMSASGLSISHISSMAGESGEGLSDQAPVVNWDDFARGVDYNTMDKATLLLEANKVMREKMIQRPNGMKMPVWECLICRKESNLKTNLRKHVYAIHFKAERYRCNKCGASFLWNGAFTHHRMFCGQQGVTE